MIAVVALFGCIEPAAEAPTPGPVAFALACADGQNGPGMVGSAETTGVRLAVVIARTSGESGTYEEGYVSADDGWSWDLDAALPAWMDSCADTLSPLWYVVWVREGETEEHSNPVCLSGGLPVEGEPCETGIDSGE